MNYQVYLINFDYYLNDSFASLEDAIKAAKNTSFECRIDCDSKPVYAISAFYSRELR